MKEEAKEVNRTKHEGSHLSASGCECFNLGGGERKWAPLIIALDLR